jgi:hypothetical protein
MRKITLLLFVISFLFVTCKKDKKTTPLYDITGTWSLQSWQESYAGGGFDATVDQYPCLAGNLATYTTDNTSTGIYTGTSACEIDPVGGGKFVLGEPGQPPLTETYTRTGNNLYFGKVRGTITSTNGKLYITLVDTLYNLSSSQVIITTVDVKH